MTREKASNSGASTPDTALPGGWQAYGAFTIGILAVSTGAIFARTAESPALVTAAYRVGLAALVVLPFGVLKAGHELRRLSLKDISLAAASGFFLALHFAVWISSLDYTSVANSVVLVNTNPIWVGLLSPLVTGERVRLATGVGIVLSVAGAVVIGAGDMNTEGGAIVGDLLALAGGLCAALYLLLGRNLRRKLSLTAYVTVCYTSAAVLLWGVVLSLGLPISGFGTPTWISLWGMALVAQVIGHSSYNWALKWFGAGLVAVSLLGEPIGATIMAYFLFGEGVTAVKFVGGGLILTAICVTAAGERRG